MNDPIYAIIKLQDYCFKVRKKTKKIEYYLLVAERAGDVNYVPDDYDIFELDEYIRKERNKEIKEALQEISDYLCSF